MRGNRPPFEAPWTAVEVLQEAGITAAIKTPDPRPAHGFVRVLMLTGQDVVRPGVVVRQPLEIEAWAATPLSAARLADRALGVLQDAEGTRGIRRVTVEEHIGELPTGEAGWDRYRFTVGLELRQSTERVART